MGKKAKRAPDEADMLVKEIKSSSAWHHDIKFIDGKFVEDVVLEYQGNNSPELIKKIIDNFSIFRRRWGRAFAPFLDDDIEDGEQMHDNIVWRSATKFQAEKARKQSGRSFNAYLVSALLNQLKNLRNARMSHKNHPRAQCPICGELVYQVDEKHLQHKTDLKRYIKTYPTYPLVSLDGNTQCPITGISIPEVTVQYINRIAGRYTMEDFATEFNITRKGPYRCPLTGTTIEKLDDAYLSGFLPGYTIKDFVRDFPDFPGLIKSPFNGEMVVEMTQEHLDKVLENDGTRLTVESLGKDYPNFTLKARQIPVMNPYTGQEVPELTLAMLSAAGTTLKEHLGKYSNLTLDRNYYELVSCPFTGRRTHAIKTSDLEKLGKTVLQFYQAVCKYPFRKFQVKCAVCGDWVDNIWTHLEEKEHNYSQIMDIEEFENSYGTGATKKTVSTNSFVESDSGDQVHIADLFREASINEEDVLEIEDSLLEVAEDDLDRSIAKAVRIAQRVEDVYFLVTRKEFVDFPEPFSPSAEKAIRDVIRDQLGITDFDFVSPPEENDTDAEIMTPSRQTVKRRLRKLISDSDIGEIDLEE